ncbi:ABC transporter substrate-binding protein [Eubacteriales bacterium OttesenSCG-928-N13]|nr:ABC transporter substrate-binding protein [Eubacteriales bacterium OttesenSCG-928-N13]
MKRMALCMLALVLLLSGCSGRQEPESSSLIVGFAQLGSESGWRVGNTEDIRRAAEEAGVQLILKNADQKQENQIKALRSFISLQVDVIAFSPIVEDGWDNVLTEAKQAGIPVLLTDRKINVEDENLFAGFVGSDFLEEGRDAGRFLLQKMAGKQDVRIVEIAGTIGSTPAGERADGFREIIAEQPGWQVVHSVSGDFLRSKGKECMSNILDEVQDIDVMFSHNDAMTLGAIEAIEQAGLNPGKDIVIITVDGEQGAIDLLMQGKINCVVECTPLIGDLIMQLSKKLAAGEAIPRITHSSERVFSEYDENLEHLPARGY